MSLAPHLATLCDLLHGRCRVPVTLGRPDGVTSGLHVWPWRLTENMAVRNLPPLRRPDGDRPRPLPLPEIHFLVLPAAAFDAGSLRTLETARDALIECPILEVGAGRSIVEIEPLSTADLAAVFSAAGIPMGLCLAGVLRSA